MWPGTHEIINKSLNREGIGKIPIDQKEILKKPIKTKKVYRLSPPRGVVTLILLNYEMWYPDE